MTDKQTKEIMRTIHRLENSFKTALKTLDKLESFIKKRNKELIIKKELDNLYRNREL